MSKLSNHLLSFAVPRTSWSGGNATSTRPVWSRRSTTSSGSSGRTRTASWRQRNEGHYSHILPLVLWWAWSAPTHTRS